jgi:hypothetical protein
VSADKEDDDPWLREFGIDERHLRQFTIVFLSAMLERPVDLPEDCRLYIANRLLPILEREEAAARGRGDRVEGAGEMVQAFVESGMTARDARKLVAHRTGLKHDSVASAHRRFLKTGRHAMLYGRPIRQPR